MAVESVLSQECWALESLGHGTITLKPPFVYFNSKKYSIFPYCLHQLNQQISNTGSLDIPTYAYVHRSQRI